MNEDIHKWTDGRYTLMFDEHTFFVWDNEKEKRMTALQVTKKLNEQQGIIEEKNNVITLMGAFIKNNGFSIDDFNEWISKDWHNVGDK